MALAAGEGGRTDEVTISAGSAPVNACHPSHAFHSVSFTPIETLLTHRTNGCTRMNGSSIKMDYNNADCK